MLYGLNETEEKIRSTLKIRVDLITKSINKLVNYESGSHESMTFRKPYVENVSGSHESTTFMRTFMPYVENPRTSKLLHERIPSKT